MGKIWQPIYEFEVKESDNFGRMLAEIYADELSLADALRSNGHEKYELKMKDIHD